jgi:signal peptidase II|tara:strand:- start:2812 stop:3297 length:486 start_codon:yes stop_codon:yes gene_type:complete
MFENKINLKKIDIYSLVLVIIGFAADRFSKEYIINLIQTQDREVFVNDYLNLTLNWNTGIAFGLLSLDTNFLYHSISALILLIIAYLVYLMVTSDNISKIFISLIIGGALGNLYDRITYYAVPDFIDFHFENFHWFTFNVADVLITIGIFGIIFKEFIIRK